MLSCDILKCKTCSLAHESYDEGWDQNFITKAHIATLRRLLCGGTLKSQADAASREQPACAEKLKVQRAGSLKIWPRIFWLQPVFFLWLPASPTTLFDAMMVADMVWCKNK